MQPEVAAVQPELARQAGGDGVLDPGAVVLDVLEQGRLGRDQAAGGDEAIVPVRAEPGDGRGQRQVQLAQDGAGQLAAGQPASSGLLIPVSYVLFSAANSST